MENFAEKTCKTVNDIRLNTEATPEILDTLNPDVVIAAVGSKPIVPDIPGVDKEKALTGIDVYLNTGKIGQNVVVIGGGTLGCESALFLAKQGRKVTIVEMSDKIGDLDGNYWYYLALIEAVDNDPNVSCQGPDQVVEVTPEGVLVEKDGKKEAISADSVVFCIGQTSEAESLDKLRMSGRRFCSVGDCVEPKKIMQATRTGFFAAMNIM